MKVKAVRFFASVKIRGLERTYINTTSREFEGIELHFNHELRQLAVVDNKANPESNLFDKVIIVVSENIPQIFPLDEKGWWSEGEVRRGRPPKVESVVQAAQ